MMLLHRPKKSDDDEAFEDAVEEAFIRLREEQEEEREREEDGELEEGLSCIRIVQPGLHNGQK